MSELALRYAPQILDEEIQVAGYWRVIVYPKRPGFPSAVDISSFRGIPVKPSSFSTSDPGGPKDAVLELPQITYYDRRGEGDLWWLHPYADVELRWVPAVALPPTYPYGVPNFGFDPAHSAPNKTHTPRLLSITPGYSWYGRIEPFDYSGSGLSLALKGQLFCFDDFMAKPEYAHYPYPYEWAIARALTSHPSIYTTQFRIAWPQWWTRHYVPQKLTAGQDYLIPKGVSPGALWTGLVTRQTGSWDPLLTSYVFGLLSSMYTERGRWTLDIMGNWTPVLIHRELAHAPGASTIHIDPTNLDADALSFREDWSQAIGVVYGQGKSMAGNQYSGMQVSPDGMLTHYDPLAFRRQAHPESEKNPWFDPAVARKEVLLQMQQGLDELQARDVAVQHQLRFGDPGVTGTVALKIDPTISDGAGGMVTLPKHLIRAGMEITIPGLLGRPEGILATVTDTAVDLTADTNTLTYDTKWRDAKTVAEVRQRGRDALAIQRSLVVGVYEPPISDQLVPWDYSRGSGYIPSGPTWRSQRLFDQMPQDLEFPWEDWTTTHQPQDPKWRKCYLGIGNSHSNSDFNWAFDGKPKGARLAIPVTMSQAGTIRLVQMAAYDRYGNVLPVGFHFSLWKFHGVGLQTMPKITAGDDRRYNTYRAGQHYPFGEQYWERYTNAGTLQDPNVPQPATQGGLIRGWGDFYEKAGYWPGSSGRGDSPTGLYADESTWSFDLSEGANQFDPYSEARTKLAPYKGMAFMMVYCDEQGDGPVFFLGRMFRAEPGSES